MITTATSASATPLLLQTVAGDYTFNAPSDGTYEIDAFGGKGGTGSGDGAGGLGALVGGEFTLTSGEVLHIIVGAVGSGAAGGGSASAVFLSPTSILVVAGAGGGGAPQQFGGAGDVGQATMNGTAGGSSGSFAGGSGGTGGGNGANGGGTYPYPGGGGTGWNSASALGTVLPTVLAGGTWHFGAGGGGYSGGGGGAGRQSGLYTFSGGPGGGGGSYIDSSALAITYDIAGGNSNSYGEVVISQLTSTSTSVPESAPLTILAVSLAGLAMARRGSVQRGKTA